MAYTNNDLPLMKAVFEKEMTPIIQEKLKKRRALVRGFAAPVKGSTLHAFFKKSK